MKALVAWNNETLEKKVKNIEHKKSFVCWSLLGSNADSHSHLKCS